jgi:uncharacterized protein YjbJ (UPF0337 family)
MQRALEARHAQQRRNKMADRDTGTQDHSEGAADKGKGEGLVNEVTGTVQDTVQGTTGTAKDAVKDTLGTVQDTVGDVKDTL